MPLDKPSDGDFLVQTEPVTLASGLRVGEVSPGPQLQRLQRACEVGSLAETEQILAEITPLPIGAIPAEARNALRECLRTAVVHQHRDLVRAMLLPLGGGFLAGGLANLGIHAAFHAGDIDTLQVFIDCGWDVNEVESDNMRPLLRHAVDSPELRRFLLARGASPNTPNERGLTTLETAVQGTSVEVVKELLEHGGDPATDDSLILAVQAGRLDVAKLLLERGADVNALSKELPHPWGQRRRMTALEAAIEGNHQHIVQWLKSNGATAGNY